MSAALITGFKGANNSSSALALAVTDCIRCSGAKADMLLLTNSVDGLRRDILKLPMKYKVVLMLGVDTTLRDSVRIERTALIDGKKQETTADAQATEILHSVGIICSVSNEPTAYLCNAAYYYMMEKMDGKVLFIHIPPVRFLTNSMAQLAGCCAELVSRLAIGGE